MTHASRTVRVGFIATMVIVVVGYLISMATSAKQQKNWGTPYHVIFNRAEGLEEGSKVFYNGRLVGRVRKLAVQTGRDEATGLDIPMRADVTISISPLYTSSVTLTRDSQYKIGGRLWGERWLSIEYEPGDAVAANESVMGDSVPSLTHRLTHADQSLDWFREMLAHWRKELGGGEKTRKRLIALIRDWNDLAFDLRVQANKFNQFSGLISDQLDKAAQAADARIASVHAQGTLAVSRMRLYAGAMRQTAVQQGERSHDVALRLLAQMGVLRSAISRLDVFVAHGDKLSADLLAAAREQVEDAEEKVAALRFISKNPAFASQFRALAAELRKRSGDMRAAVDALRRDMPRKSSATSPALARPRSEMSAPVLPRSTVEPLPGVAQPPLVAPSREGASQVQVAPSSTVPAPSPTGH
ncbi:MAG: MCE family protein [Proteobacteria bacterium]|nr:MCE family protein [Pseudomonadota bacterium]